VFERGVLRKIFRPKRKGKENEENCRIKNFRNGTYHQMRTV
jgi:hypothetical protein